MSEHHHHLLVRGEEAKRVTLVGAVVNLVLSVIKIVIGVVANSQSLLADGIHSLSDLISDALVWFAADHAADAPDEDHPYGHGRYETVATLALGILLILVAIGISWDAIERLFSPEELMVPGYFALYAAAFSIVVKELLYHYTAHIGRKTRSKMLMANAWHHRSDAVSSIVVLVGVAGALNGLEYLDAVAAVIVGIMIAKIGWELGWESIHELADTALDEERVAAIRQTILKVGGVVDLHMLRTRTLGGHASADVHVLVQPRISVSEGHMISVLVEQALKKEIDEIEDVTVHIDPEDDEKAPPTMGLPQRGRVEAMLRERWQRLELDINSDTVTLHYLNGKLNLEVNVVEGSPIAADAAASLSYMKDQLADQDYIDRIDLLVAVRT